MAEPRAVRSRLGVVPQETALYEELSARENLRFWGGMYGLSGRDLKDAIGRILEQVGLSLRADEPVRGFSGGMTRRLNLALGLVHRPAVVLLGGQAKAGSGFSSLVESLRRHRAVITFGDSGDQIATALSGSGLQPVRVASMDQAVQRARALAN